MIFLNESCRTVQKSLYSFARYVFASGRVQRSRSVLPQIIVLSNKIADVTNVEQQKILMNHITQVQACGWRKLKNKVFPATGSDSQKKQLSRVTILKMSRGFVTE